MPFEFDFLPVTGLLQALPGEAPAGRNLRLDVTPQSLYFRLRDARAEARAEERLVDNDPTATDGASRHWKTIHDLATEALATSTKDIEITAWLTESLVRSHGLSGLAAGAQLLQGLVETFWNNGLFPPAEADDTEDRLAAVAGLNGQESNGTLMQPLRKTILFEMAGEPIGFWQFEQAEEAAAITDATRRNQRLATGVLLLADLEAEARGAGRVALDRLGKDLVQAIAAWNALDTTLSNVAGNAAPSTRRVHDLLAKQRRIVERYAGPIETSDAGDPEEVAPATAVPETGQKSPGYDREVLLGEITRIARLFRTHEPNAPLSYTLDDAVRRARLAWPELLREMMPEMASRAALLTSLGIRHQPE